jgi:hypothetical protein
VQVQVVAMLRLSVAWVTCRYSQVGEYYYYSLDKIMERKWWPGRDKKWVIGGCNKLCPATTGLSLVTLFFLYVSIEDRPLLWMVVRSQTYYPEHILAYGSGNARCSFIVGSGSFRTDWLESRKGGGLSTTLRLGLTCGGVESKFGRGPGSLDRSGMSWSCLCLGYKRDVCFEVPSWDTLVHESLFP